MASSTGTAGIDEPVTSIGSGAGIASDIDVIRCSAPQTSVPVIEFDFFVTRSSPAMPRHELDLDIAIQSLDDDLYLAEALFFPEFSRFGSSQRYVASSVALNAKHLVPDLLAREVYRRHPSSEPVVGTVELDVSPPNRSLAFSKPIQLEFHTLRWFHGDDLQLAYVPTLGIEVHAKTVEELNERLPQEIRAALFRTKALKSLEQLVFLQHSRSLVHRRVTVLAERRTPKQQEVHENTPTSTKSTLREVGRKLTRWATKPAFEVDDLVENLAEALSSPQRPSVLLVGPSGVGKTALVHELVRRRRDLSSPLRAATFWATSGSRLVAGQSGFGMWQERCQALCKEAKDTFAILHLGNLVELLHVGKSEHNAQGIASFLKPFIQRGELQVIVECTPDAVALIEGDDPQLPKLFHQILVEPPTRQRLIEILRQVAEERSQRGSANVTRDALETLERLHRRYARYSASPGRPLRFLESLLRDRHSSDNCAVIERTDIATAFARETGLPDFMVDDDLPLDLEATRSFFSKRVLGQPHAVNLTVDVLATTKTALGRPGKPLASLMLVGPTGVGKTELAKVLAEFLFGSSSRLTRFDMSEYTDVGAVGRLTGAFGQGSGDGQLTAKVREEPFSVVLLDEIEKGHPLFFDLLLQVLGEARLTDARGHVADFSSTVVIMTSNLGAEAFSRHPLGFRDGDFNRVALDTVLNAVREFYRPELMNRIDRVVPFAPLDEDTLDRIATLQLRQLQTREGVAYRALELNVEDGVASWLARKGYDPRYGARPLRRSIERELLAPLSTAVNRYGNDMSLKTRVQVKGPKLDIDLQFEPAKGTSQSSHLSVSSGRLKTISDLSDERRKFQQVMRSPAAIDMRNGIFRLARSLERMERRRLRGRPLPQRYDEHKRRIARLRRVEQQLQSHWSSLCEDEERALLALYQGRLDDEFATIPDKLTRLSRATTEALLALYCLRFERPDHVTLAIYGRDDVALGNLSTAYFDLLRSLKAEVTPWRFALEEDDVTKVTTVRGRRIVFSPAQYRSISAASKGALGIALEIHQSGALPRFSGEAGLHQVILSGEKDSKQELLIHCSESTGERYVPPHGVERSTLTKHRKLRRTHQLGLGHFDDKVLNRKIRASYWAKLHLALSSAIDEALFAIIAKAVLR